MLSKLNCWLAHAIAVICLSFCTISHLQTKKTDYVNIAKAFVEVNGASGSVVKAWEEKDGFYAHVLTACHVLDAPDYIFGVKAKFRISSKEYELRGKIKESDKERDFAIIEFKTPFRAHSILINEVVPPLGDEVMTIGYPHGSFMMTKGVVGCFPVIVNKHEFIGHSAQIYYGNSGGLLINKDGQQIGITVAIDYDYNRDIPITHKGIATPFYEIKNYLGVRKFNYYFKD